jgi:hypothetical protein
MGAMRSQSMPTLDLFGIPRGRVTTHTQKNPRRVRARAEAVG